jgi:hypothetical protein
MYCGVRGTGYVLRVTGFAEGIPLGHVTSYGLRDACSVLRCKVLVARIIMHCLVDSRWPKDYGLWWFSRVNAIKEILYRSYCDARPWKTKLYRLE